MLGSREQKRLYYSPGGDSICGEFYNHHSWTYYMLGAGGEQLAVYKGVQAAHEDSSGHMGRRVYMYNESYISLGGTLVTLPDNTKQFNAMDNIGSVRLTVSAKEDSIRIQSFDYKPFGDTLNAEDESRIGYASQERDEESRYFAMGARQYDPLAGRFLSVDPLYEAFPDKTPYHYCNNNPISFKDPSGLSPEGEKGKENEVQICYGDDDKRMSEQMRQQIQDNFDEARNKKKQLAESVGKGEAMSDAARARMSEWSDGSGGGNGMGFDNRRIEDDNGDRTGKEGTGNVTKNEDTGVIEFTYNGLAIKVKYSKSKMSGSSTSEEKVQSEMIKFLDTFTEENGGAKVLHKAKEWTFSIEYDAEEITDCYGGKAKMGRNIYGSSSNEWDCKEDSDAGYETCDKFKVGEIYFDFNLFTGNSLIAKDKTYEYSECTNGLWGIGSVTIKKVNLGLNEVGWHEVFHRFESIDNPKNCDFDLREDNANDFVKKMYKSLHGYRLIRE